MPYLNDRNTISQDSHMKEKALSMLNEYDTLQKLAAKTFFW